MYNAISAPEGGALRGRGGGGGGGSKLVAKRA